MTKREVVGLLLLLSGCGDDDVRTATEQQVAVTPCEDQDLSSCALDARCMTISGSRVDYEHLCLGEAHPLACLEQQNCSAAIVVAEDPQGARWWFSSGCLPPSYSDASGSEAAINFSPCESAPPAATGCPVGTARVHPGCGTPEPTWEEGCYASCSAVGDGTGCAPGYSCQETWVNPCVPKRDGSATCDACGALTRLCLPTRAAK